jgi:Zn-dependent protease/CBS domain-containing protein
MLFLSIFGHELAHALMARAEGIKTLEIVLHPFGGLARLERAPDTAREEFRIAVAGPAASFLFAFMAFMVRGGVATVAGYSAATGILYLIGWWNFLLAFFNLLPGYPLDGGRILRAAIWHRTGNLTEATRITSLGGQAIGWTLIVIGAYVVFVWDDWLLGVWSIVVGEFLREAAADVLTEVGGVRGTGFPGFGRRTAGEAMMAPVALEPETLVSHFVDTVLPVHRRAAVLVARDNRLHGILTLEDLKRLPRERWARTPVRDVMRVVADNLFVDSRLPLADAEEIMRTNGVGALGVVNRAGELVGFLQPRSKQEGREKK